MRVMLADVECRSPQDSTDSFAGLQPQNTTQERYDQEAITAVAQMKQDRKVTTFCGLTAPPADNNSGLVRLRCRARALSLNTCRLTMTAG